MPAERGPSGTGHAPGLFERLDHPGWNGCHGHGRHWFTMRGQVGVKTPRCVRCGFPRPGNGLTTDDWCDLYDLDWSGLTEAEREWIEDGRKYGWGESA